MSLTYNSFAERIVAEHGMRIGIDPDFTMLTEAGAVDLMTQIVEGWPTDLDEDLSPSAAVGHCLHLAGEVGEHGYTVEEARDALEGFGRDLEQIGGTNDTARKTLRANARRLAYLGPVEEFQRRKREGGLLDFSDQLVGFLLFRLFDITKPAPIRTIDSQWKNAIGVLLDDLLAAAYTVIVMAVWTRLFG